MTESGNDAKRITDIIELEFFHPIETAVCLIASRDDFADKIADRLSKRARRTEREAKKGDIYDIIVVTRNGDEIGLRDFASRDTLVVLAMSPKNADSKGFFGASKRCIAIIPMR